MYTLLFGKDEVAEILKGERRQAIRLDRHDLYTGQRVHACTVKRGKPVPFAELELTIVRLVRVDKIRDRDAVRLKEMYPVVERFWVFGFKVVEAIQ